MPWALKFLWAPAVDRVGTRKSWIVPLQLGTVAILVALAVSPVSTPVLLTAVLLSNLVAATQDISRGSFHVEVRAYALEDAAQAHRDVEKHHLGKLALRMH